MKLTRKDTWIYEVMVTDAELAVILQALRTFNSDTLIEACEAEYLEERIGLALAIPVGETVAP